MNSKFKKKSWFLSNLVIIAFLFVEVGCCCTKHINITCHPLSDYNRIKIVDYRTVNDTVFDSIQYRDYLLSFSDTSNVTMVSGEFLLEKCYQFNKGLVLIVDNDSIKYEVIVIVDNPSDNTKRIVEGKHYQMKVTPFFLLRKGAYISEIRKDIYHKHYVIHPAYILHDESRICTANLMDIVDCDNNIDKDD